MVGNELQRSGRYSTTRGLIQYQRFSTSLLIATVASLLLQQVKVSVKVELSVGHVFKFILEPLRRYTRPALNCLGLHHREGGPSVEQRPSRPKKPFLGQKVFGSAVTAR